MAATLTYVTPDGVKMTVTGTPTELAQFLVTVPEAPAKNKTASPKRKGGKKKAAPEEPKVVLVSNRSLDRINKAAGTKFRKAVCFVEAVRDGKAVLPEGFAFGDTYAAYLASGQSRKEFFGS